MFNIYYVLSLFLLSTHGKELKLSVENIANIERFYGPYQLDFFNYRRVKDEKEGIIQR